MAWCRRRFPVLSLPQLLDFLATARPIPRHVVVTFDDGYVIMSASFPDFAISRFPPLSS
jgi:hypothetical protein